MSKTVFYVANMIYTKYNSYHCGWYRKVLVCATVCFGLYHVSEYKMYQFLAHCAP